MSRFLRANLTKLVIPSEADRFSLPFAKRVLACVVEVLFGIARFLRDESLLNLARTHLVFLLLLAPFSGGLPAACSQRRVREAGFEVSRRIDHGLPLVSIDPDAISLAVMNLVNNATKYSEDTKKIEVAVGARDSHIAIEVADHGIGIPRSEQQKIFEKFYRVSTALVHNTKGSGLGLALVKHIAEAHGGSTLVDSEPGRGSRFAILIPIPKTEAVSKRTGVEIRGYPVEEGSHH